MGAVLEQANCRTGNRTATRDEKASYHLIHGTSKDESEEGAEGGVTGKEEDDRPDGISDDDYFAQVAGGKAMSILLKRERGYFVVEHDSVYGAAVAMPQFARSVGWSETFTALAIRSYLFLGINIFLQGYLLYMIDTEEQVMNKFAGQMHLCDFGASLRECPGRSDCYGPAGTEYTPARLYPFGQWVTRMFVRDAMQQLFPDRADEIMDKIDIGEWGMESYHCRLVCIFVFVLALCHEIKGTLEMSKLCLYVPTRAEPWLTYESPSWASLDQAKAIHGWSELDLCVFKVAGMPLFWKFMTFVFVLGPKLFIWFKTLKVGVGFLMETASITDLIVNAMALTFVLSLDEMIFSILMSPSTKYMLEKLEGFPLFRLDDEEDDTMREAFDKHAKSLAWNWTTLRFYWNLVPIQFLLVCVVTFCSIFEYYYNFCVYDKERGYVAEDLKPPLGATLPLQSFLQPYLFPVPKSEVPMWHMPEV